jgi:hypothetical protein
VSGHRVTRNRDVVRPMVIVAVVIGAVVALIVPATAYAWQPYSPTETYWCILDDPTCPGDGSHDPYDISGTNYWTNNRIYRPSGHPVQLAYTKSSTWWWSSTGYTNPFYFTQYHGYSQLWCEWMWWEDNVYRISPVTCQGNS